MVKRLVSTDLGRVSDYIADQMGLHFPRERWADLEQGLERAAPELGYADLRACAAGLPGAPLTQHQIKVLAAHLTVGETHFFRSPRAFELLQSWILPELIAARRATTRSLRLWSAGCAAGQEPYSLAIAVSRLIPDLRDWDVTILATDINPQVLEIADAGVYSQWSFRGTPAWVTTSYFSKVGEGRFRIDPAIKSMVTFRFLNLVDNIYPSAATGVFSMDVILCRNVLIYFSAETTQLVAGRLHDALADDGYLLVAPSEASSALFPQFTPMPDSGEIVFRKRSPEDAAALRPASSRSSLSEGGQGPNGRLMQRRRRSAARAASRAPERTQGPLGVSSVSAAPAIHAAATAQDALVDTPAGPAEQARSLADRGRLEEALDRCEIAIKSDKLNPALHYLRASILQELGLHDRAVEALHSTLYLDSGFALARLLLGTIARGQARSVEASKHFQAALDLLQRLPRDSVVGEAGGLTAGDLAQTVAALIDSESVA